MKMFERAWREYRLKNFLRWRAYHIIGRVAWRLIATQQRLHQWRTMNDALIEARLWQQ